VKGAGLSVRGAILAITVTLACASASPARSPVDGPFLSYGQTKHGVHALRLGLRAAFPFEVLKSPAGCLSGHAETAVVYWANGDETAYGGVVAPFVAYYFGNELSSVRPYVGGGIGLAYMSKTRMGSRDLATRFQFEDRAGIGFEAGRLDAFLCVMHYSNGSVKAPNMGLDAFSLTLAWSLE
jgi:lipid A 3-O-deacylase